MDIEPKIPAGWSGKEPAVLRHFGYSSGKTTGREQDVQAGARILSIDLGVRGFAACSVFELSHKADRLSFPVAVGKRSLHAVHERSFKLQLPNEKLGSKADVWRVTQMDEMRRLRRVLGRYRRVMNLASNEATEERVAALDDQITAVQDEAADQIGETALLSLLKANASMVTVVWQEEVKNTLSQYRARLGPVFRQWRRNSRQSPHDHVGKSMWAIDYFTQMRRLLMSWSLLGRESGDVRRADLETRGTFARGVLRHITGMKADRLKTGSDLVVQAARGYLRNRAGEWEQRFEPCEVILFEDLSRYRMKTDRPRSENSQLMKWAHRQIPAEVTMQGELYGLHVTATAAQFSSRYRAVTYTPGVRGKRVSWKELQAEYFCEQLTRDGVDPSSVRVGDLV